MPHLSKRSPSRCSREALELVHAALSGGQIRRVAEQRYPVPFIRDRCTGSSTRIPWRRTSASRRLLSQAGLGAGEQAQAGQTARALAGYGERPERRPSPARCIYAARHSAQADGLELSAVLGMLVGALFQDVEKNATLWQRLRGSQMTQAWGYPSQAPLADER